MSSAIRSLAESDPVAAARYLEKLAPANDNEHTGFELTLFVIRQWAAGDLSAAREWILGQADGDSKYAAMGELIRVWAAESPEESSHWLAEQPPGAATDHGIRGLTETIVDSDPEAAVKWASSMSDGPDRTHTVKRMMRRWIRKDYRSSLAWLRESQIFSDEEYRSFLEELSRE